MTRTRQQNGFRVYTLQSSDGRTRAEIVPELGGILSSLVLTGPGGPQECLYQHAWFWDPATEATRGGNPVLFPVCGRLRGDGIPGRYRIDGQPYQLPLHGFAMHLPWQVRDADAPDSLRLRLVDTAHTRAQYPFSFVLEMHCRVASAGATCTLAATNTGDRPMPWYAGFHPYFAAPPPGPGKSAMRYEVPARARWLYNETKSDITGAMPPPAMPVSIADPDINDILLELGPDRTSRIRFPDGFAIRHEASALFGYRQLYTLPDQPFFCDEPWMAPPGSLNRPGAAPWLAPGETASGTVFIGAEND